MSTTDRVLDILVQEGGYRQLPNPFKVGSISFDFTHALVAGERANDLVIVIELKGDTVDDGITRKVMALTRALDVMRSKRPVTAVLTSGQPRMDTLQSISKVCRVLPIGAPTGPDAIGAVRDWLAVLLPLTQPPAVDALLDWEADLRAATAASAKGELTDALIGAAPRGKEAVETVLADALASSINVDDGDEE
ncbi:hypothetical protein ELI33_08515 [Rhizobium ruizarguesonis]|uniref:hypothetical protein n=1 Tax=Rhizobium TaxID=379 RepID=UPI00102FA192|nr:MULTISPECIES: hypothetical protein [Rhizobium]MBY5448110.1 hypothetical protein [Rhizobium leguminosarum]TAV37267.1 hypothetical protein ELI33_08515 [Rhizobium ruizarguesonis]